MLPLFVAVRQQAHIAHHFHLSTCRVWFKAELLDRGPVCATAVANKSGWVNEEIFTQWFDCFLQFFQPKHKTSPCLLIMDGHSSHTNNLELIMKARENNVCLLVLPSHSTHKIQPLDVAVFKSLNCYYDRARSKPDTVDRPVKTAYIFVHHYNSTQYCKTETVFFIFPVPPNQNHMWPSGGKGGYGGLALYVWFLWG